MANWCSTNYVIESDNKELLQKICDTINECAKMNVPLIQATVSNWVGNIFLRLGMDPNEADRTFWSCAEMKNGHLEFSEESAWTRGEAIVALQEHFIDDNDDYELEITYISEELGCGVFQTNDYEQVWFKDRYIFRDDDDTCYYDNFEEFEKDVRECLKPKRPYKDFYEISRAVEKKCRGKNRMAIAVYAVEYVDLND